jgi:hypothetical protein
MIILATAIFSLRAMQAFGELRTAKKKAGASA